MTEDRSDGVDERDERDEALRPFWLADRLLITHSYMSGASARTGAKVSCLCHIGPPVRRSQANGRQIEENQKSAFRQTCVVHCPICRDAKHGDADRTR